MCGSLLLVPVPYSFHGETQQTGSTIGLKHCFIHWKCCVCVCVRCWSVGVSGLWSDALCVCMDVCACVRMLMENVWVWVVGQCKDIRLNEMHFQSRFKKKHILITCILI